MMPLLFVFLFCLTPLALIATQKGGSESCFRMVRGNGMTPENLDVESIVKLVGSHRGTPLDPYTCLYRCTWYSKRITEYLNDLGFTARTVEVVVEDPNTKEDFDAHWVTLLEETWLIDLTADQFNTWSDSSFPAITIGRINDLPHYNIVPSSIERSYSEAP